MADEAYRARVDDVCAQLGITNPIDQQKLKIRSLFFMFDDEEPLPVETTGMNLAGMAFMQLHTKGSQLFRLDDAFREKARAFFPDPHDCSRTRRTLVYGATRATQLEIAYR